jgi:ElaB/YqjD/DUF883 family membrane-anchored ribosome-binding protein
MPTRREAADELRSGSAAVRVNFQWWGSTKSLDARHKSQVASLFDANAKSLTAGKRLFDTKDPAYAALVRIKGEIAEAWKGASLPYVEDGVRLIPHSRVPELEATFAGLKVKFNEAVEALAQNYDDIKAAARERLGVLFNEGDYPQDVREKFGFAWDYPNTEPPQYLMTLNPRLYEEEQRRVRARFEEAAALAEQAFAQQLAELAEHLAERLKPDAEGKKKVFRNTAIDGFKDFFAQFKSLSVRSNPELDALVQRAEQVMTGVEADGLRKDADARARVGASLEQLRDQLGSLVTTQSRRTWRRTETPERPAGAERHAGGQEPKAEETQAEETQAEETQAEETQAEGQDGKTSWPIAPPPTAKTTAKTAAETAAEPAAPATCPHGAELRVADFCQDCVAEEEAEEAAGATAGGAA